MATQRVKEKSEAPDWEKGRILKRKQIDKGWKSPPVPVLEKECLIPWLHQEMLCPSTCSTAVIEPKSHRSQALEMITP